MAKVKLKPAEVEAIARAIADPRRFAILKQVAAAESCPCSGLQAHDCLSPATISHHLKELQEAGLVDAVRDGRKMNLSLRRDVWDAYVAQLNTL